ncbi:GNAT family N-acetyltransferase [Planococcus sp. N064]|uniref:GNAT family N-acetyltransferase n=1 Tax=Planococcus liqunii TaxID=3058394 RepID=A0ABT8MTZ3_9BACL|nr:GNAT family N-acetyltransferase [Planococcus sp. N064]MDN7228378.1 GNAT family N-acetyltransferase [Planococcus sp. N064]
MKIIKKGLLPYRAVEPVEEKDTGLAVIFYHGWGTTAESYLEFAEALAEEGYRVILPELIYHDSRNLLANPFYPPILQEFFWKTIFTSMDEFDGLLEELKILAHQLIVAGSSMGGFIAAGMGARQKQLAGIASINGSGSFLLTEQLLRTRDLRPVLSPDEKILLKHYDPAKSERFSGPMLLLHGKEDPVIPVEGQMAYYQCRVKKYGPQQTKMILYDGVGHQFTDEMAAAFIEWLKGLQQSPLTAKELVTPFISQEIKSLLGYATSPGQAEEAYEEYMAAANQRLYRFEIREDVVGCIGIHLEEGQLKIRHIAVTPEARGQGIGGRMIEWIQTEHSPCVVVAETDRKAVEFYRKTGFTAISLGEKYPGVERFQCERKEIRYEKC